MAAEPLYPSYKNFRQLSKLNRIEPILSSRGDSIDRRRAGVSVIGLADAAGIRHGHAWEPPYVRTMNMSVNHNPSAKR